jgi:hypothetical protein
VIARPTTVRFDLSDPDFRVQLVELKRRFPELFREFSAAVRDYAGMPWAAFEALTFPDFIEAAFDGSYLVLRLYFLHGEMHVLAHLESEILSLVRIQKPILHL